MGLASSDVDCNSKSRETLLPLSLLPMRGCGEMGKLVANYLLQCNNGA